jgi:hypothetical protein
MKQDENLPAELSQGLMQTNEENRDAILKYLETGGEGALLTSKQEELLERYVYTDELIRRNVGKKKREEIANMITTRWNVSRTTAYTYMVATEHVFSSSTPLNKAYFIQNRMEFLERVIRECAAMGDHKAAAMYEKSLVKYVEIFPEYKAARSPKNIIYNMVQNNVTNNVTNNNQLNVGAPQDGELLLDDALRQADDIIKQIEENDDY